jgi:hypothetical protein
MKAGLTLASHHRSCTTYKSYGIVCLMAWLYNAWNQAKSQLHPLYRPNYTPHLRFFLFWTFMVGGGKEGYRKTSLHATTVHVGPEKAI